MPINPLQWSKDLKTLGGLLMIIITIIGTSWTAANTIAGKIYNFAEGQTLILQNIRDLDVSLKKDVIPRVSRLETDVTQTKSDAAVAKQRVDDMAGSLRDIKELSSQNLEVSRSHTDAINATRRAVAPQYNLPPTR